MKVAPVSGFKFQNKLKQSVFNPISFGDIDDDKIIIHNKAKEIRMMPL